MKVIFKVNNYAGKYCVGKTGGPEDWLESLNKYISEDAIVFLSIFTNKADCDVNLRVVDGKKCFFAKSNDIEMAIALDKTIAKCVSQIVKSKTVNDSRNRTIRYNDEYNVSFEGISENIELNPCMQESLDLVETELDLSDMKKTARYDRTMNRYISYLWRNNEIDQTCDHLRILYSILDSIDEETEEKMTIAEYKRLCKSIIELEKEVTNLTKKQLTFENSVRDQEYINNIIEQEAKLSKLKSMK